MSVLKQMPVSVGAETRQKDFRDSHIKNNTNNIIIPQKHQYSSGNCKFYQIDVFSRVKDSLNITDVLEYYGMSVNSRGFVSCPFHQESTPSFKAYQDSFYCFGCGAGGTVIDFVVKYFHLTNIEAVRKLNDDFKLNLLFTESWGCPNWTPLRENKNLVGSFVVWEKRAFVTVSSYFRTLKFLGEQIFINHIEYFEKYLPEVENIAFVENLLDLMIDNLHDFKKQVEFYEAYGKVVETIECKYKFTEYSFC